MLIDEFTLIAQIINFFVLVLLLKRFLYKPIINAIDQRERYIALQHKQAEEKKTEAEQELDINKRMNEEFRQQRQILLNNTMSEVNTERIRLMDELHKEIETLRLNYLETLRIEQQNFSSAIIQRTQKEIFEIARKALHDLASVGLEEQMTETFLERLKALKHNERQQLISGLEQSQNRVEMQSSFDLPKIQQKKIKDEITTSFNIEPKIKFETNANIISGIALIVGGHKIMWSIDEYLNSLKSNLNNLIQGRYETK